MENAINLHKLQKVYEFVLLFYKIIIVFPKYEIYGLTSLLRTASISTIIAEGKKNDLDKLRFHIIAEESIH